MLHHASARIGVYPEAKDGLRRLGIELTRASEDGTSVEVALVGELDSMSAEQAETVLRGVLSGARFVTVTLDALSLIDSAGISVLVEIANRQEAQDGSLVLRGATGIVRTALEIARLGDFLALEGAVRR
jgi:anti-anti-sigma factor